jgi:hypothetical protein
LVLPLARTKNPGEPCGLPFHYNSNCSYRDGNQVSPDQSFLTPLEVIHLEERNRWGIASRSRGADTAPPIATLNIAPGIFRLVGNESPEVLKYNCVSAMNATDTATTIKRGDVIATFHPKDFEHTPILHMHDNDDAPTTEAPPPEGIELDAGRTCLTSLF